MDLTDSQRGIVESAMQAEGIPGLAVAIVKGGEVSAAEGFGWRNLERRSPVTPNTVFPICSLTKSMTAIAIMQQVEKGKLSLDEPVVSYLSGLLIADEQSTRKITPRILLCHKSGMGRTGHQQRMFSEERPYEDRAHLVSQLGDIRLQTPPNSAWSYCNEGFATLGHLVESVSGVALESYFQRNVFQPADMKSTHTSFDSWRGADDHAHLYFMGGEGHAEAHLPKRYDIYLSTGGVVSTALDLASYQVSNMSFANSPLLSAGSLDSMQSISMPHGDTGMGYGFGWTIQWSGGRMVVRHGGGLPGVSTHSLMVPSDGAGVVVLANLGGAPVARLAEQIMDSILEDPLDLIDDRGEMKINSNFQLSKEDLRHYTGRFRHEHDAIDVSLDGPNLKARLLLGEHSHHYSSTLAAIGADLFMLRMPPQGNEPTLLYFVRDEAGSAGSVLMGGSQYYLEGTDHCN